MGVLIVLIMVGAGLYLFFKSNTARGVELVRAYVFLGGIGAGAAVEEANRLANLDIVNGPTDIIRSAMDHLQQMYGGRQLTMIADAYNWGMSPKLPAWYRSFAGISNAGPNAS